MKDIPSAQKGFEAFWKWIPEGLIQAVPILKTSRAKSAAQHARAASAAYDDRNPDGAIIEYATAIQLEPKNSDYLYNLGRIYYEKNELVRAEDYFRQALNLNFSYAHAIKGLGYTVHRLGKIDEAIYCYLRYIEVQPDDADVHANLIAALEGEGRYDEAIRAADRAVKMFPSNVGFLVALGRNNYLAGKNDAAISHLERASQLDPRDSETHRLLGVALNTRGDREAALTSFRNAVEQDPKNAEAYLAIAQVCSELDRNAEFLQAAHTARQLFESAKNNFGVKYACWLEGWALYKLRRWAESVQASECALEIDDSLPSVRFNLGLALLRLGQVERAKREYQKAMELKDLGSLKADGIKDVTAALEEEPQLPGAREILQRLETTYQELTSRREERLSEQSSAH